HRVLAYEMLHNAIIGPIGVTNAYFQLFLEGFRLPCSSTLDICDLVRNFHGGAEEFIQTAEISVIRSFDDLNIRILDAVNGPFRDDFTSACAEAGPDFADKSFETIFQEFLEATGAPCPSVFDEIKDRFNPEINLERIDSSTFRMEILCWSVSGASRVIAEGEPLRIVLVTDEDSTYMSSSTPRARRAEYLAAGICSFKTCSRSLRIPVSYLIKLLRDAYSDMDSSFPNARSAVHHWLLVQMLEAIGSYTVL
ncbi:hypothetical protein BDP27DRAFT_1230246, partial [Rhodocollybia butyracea]